MNNKFANIIDKQSRFGITENGADALENTKHAIVDLFSTAHQYRNCSNSDINSCIDKVIKEEGINDAIKLMFYIRDIKEGMGEREVFKKLLIHVANNYSEQLVPYLKLIPELGRWDDYYVILEHVNKDNPAYHAVINIIRNQYQADLMNAFVRKPISLLAKWLKSINASNAYTRKLAKLTAKILIGYKKDYLRIYRQNLAYLRKRLNVVETDMCSNNWNDIDYEHVPAKAMLRYNKAFNKHDGEKFKEYLEDVAHGKNKINAGTLFPSDIIKNINFALMQHYQHCYNEESLNLMPKSDIDTLNALWKSLPNYVSGNHNALVMSDISESMYGNPICSSIGLGLYFAERNTGPFNNKLMLFATDPRIINFNDCNDLYSKVVKVSQQDIGYSTNIKKAFEYILQLAVDNNINNDDMIKSLIIISDMQFDRIHNMDMPKQTFYDKMKKLYAAHGYDLPKIIFWNVAEFDAGKHACFHADSDADNIIHVGGYSATAFKTIFKLSEGVTPYNMVKEIINNKRYSVNG